MRIADPIAGRRDPPIGYDRGSITDDGDDIPILPLAAIRITHSHSRHCVCNALDEAGKDLQRRFLGRGFHIVGGRDWDLMCDGCQAAV